VVQEFRETFLVPSAESEDLRCFVEVIAVPLHLLLCFVEVIAVRGRKGDRYILPSPLRVGLLDGKVICGVGVKLPYDFRLDYAYLNDYGQEVERAFDTGDMHMIGIGKKF